MDFQEYQPQFRLVTGVGLNYYFEYDLSGLPSPPVELFMRPAVCEKQRITIHNVKPGNISNENICAICLDTLNISNIVIFNCSHQFCEGCVNKLLHNHAKLSKPICPLCRTEITQLYFENKDIQNTIINTTYNFISVLNMNHVDTSCLTIRPFVTSFNS